ncbi:MAG: ABC transporter ATP-binding protein [Chthoniobacteraceae bacterium]
MNLSVHQLNFSYGREEVLKNLSASFPLGITAIVGPNGAGKSTLIQCLAGILPIKAPIWLECPSGKSSGPSMREKMAYLPQFATEAGGLTVFEMVLLGLLDSLQLHVEEQETETVWRVLEDFEIEHLAFRRVDELSGGQKQMVALAQAIIKEPEILLLDEPLNSLDLHHQFEMLDYLQTWTRQAERITLMVIHDLNLAARYADRILMLDHGAVAAHGTPVEVFTTERLRTVYYIDAEVTPHPVMGFLRVQPVALVKAAMDRPGNAF